MILEKYRQVMRLDPRLSQCAWMGLIQVRSSSTRGCPRSSFSDQFLFKLLLTICFSTIRYYLRFFFADDCVICHEMRIAEDRTLPTTALARIAKWCENWQMSLNIENTLTIPMTRRKKKTLR